MPNVRRDPRRLGQGLRKLKDARLRRRPDIINATVRMLRRRTEKSNHITDIHKVSCLMTVTLDRDGVVLKDIFAEYGNNT